MNDRHYDDFTAWAMGEIVEPMRTSALVTVLMVGTPDWSLCLQVGAAVLLDKPLLIVIEPGTKMPSKLALIADEIVEGVIGDASFAPRFQAAMLRMMGVGE